MPRPPPSRLRAVAVLHSGQAWNVRARACAVLKTRDGTSTRRNPRPVPVAGGGSRGHRDQPRRQVDVAGQRREETLSSLVTLTPATPGPLPFSAPSTIVPPHHFSTAPIRPEVTPVPATSERTGSRLRVPQCRVADSASAKRAARPGETTQPDPPLPDPKPQEASSGSGHVAMSGLVVDRRKARGRVTTTGADPPPAHDPCRWRSARK